MQNIQLKELTILHPMEKQQSLTLFVKQPYMDRLEKDGVKLKYILKRIFTLILFQTI
jgi:hypothetical protein